MALVAFLVVAMVVAIALVMRSGDEDEAASGEITLGPSEVLLEPKDTLGPDPFEDASDVTQSGPASVPTTTPTTPTSDTEAPVPETLPPTTVVATTVAPTTTTAPSPEGIQSLVGSNPGLYGGTRNNRSCDKEQMKAFLATNPIKAQAWVGALNTDPTVRWDGGTSLTTADISAFIDELTPVVLTADTRVTNHGFGNDTFTTRQVVLQAGTAVLVDRWGVPRARCLCGNPLTRPIPIAAPQTIYVGQPWPTFNPTTIVVVVPASQPIENIVIIDNRTGTVIIRPAGTDGPVDGSPPPATQPPVTQPATTVAPVTTLAPTTTQPSVPTPGSIEVSGTWNFVWGWSVTIVGFDGDVGYDAGRWTFQGQYVSGGSSSWKPTSGSADCVLAADPDAPLPTPGTMTCTVTFPEDTWTGETSGQIGLISGEVNSFQYNGTGTGTSSNGSSSITMRLTGPTTRTADLATTTVPTTSPPLVTAPPTTQLLQGTTYCERFDFYNQEGARITDDSVEARLTFIRQALVELTAIAPSDQVADLELITEFFADLTPEQVLSDTDEPPPNVQAAVDRLNEYGRDVCGITDL